MEIGIHAGLRRRPRSDAAKAAFADTSKADDGSMPVCKLPSVETHLCPENGRFQGVTVFDRARKQTASGTDPAPDLRKLNRAES